MSAYVGPCWSKLALNWHKVVHVGPTWFQVSPNLAPTWPNVGPCWVKLVPSWSQVGPKLVPSWLHVGPCWPELVQTGPIGSKMPPSGPMLVHVGPKLAAQGAPKRPQRLPKAFPEGPPRHTSGLLRMSLKKKKT